jgi:hypothetical protein
MSYSLSATNHLRRVYSPEVKGVKLSSQRSTRVATHEQHMSIYAAASPQPLEHR